MWNLWRHESLTRVTRCSRAQQISSPASAASHNRTLWKSDCWRQTQVTTFGGGHIIASSPSSGRRQPRRHWVSPPITAFPTSAVAGPSLCSNITSIRGCTTNMALLSGRGVRAMDLTLASTTDGRSGNMDAPLGRPTQPGGPGREGHTVGRVLYRYQQTVKG